MRYILVRKGIILIVTFHMPNNNITILFQNCQRSVLAESSCFLSGSYKLAYKIFYLKHTMIQGVVENNRIID